MLHQKKLLTVTALVACLCVASVFAVEVSEQKKDENQQQIEHATKNGEPKAAPETEARIKSASANDSYEDPEEAAFFEGITDGDGVNAEAAPNAGEDDMEALFNTLSDNPLVIAARNDILPLFKTAVEYSNFNKFDEYATKTERSVVALFSTIADDAEETAKLIERTAERLKAQNIPLVVLDTAFNDFFKIAFGVGDRPTLKTLHYNNVTLDFTFPEFNEDSINEYIARISLPRLCTAQTVDEIEALRDYPLAVGVFAPQDTDAITRFKKLSEELYAVMERFVLVESADPAQLLAHYKVNTPIFIIPQRGTCALKDEPGVARCVIRQLKKTPVTDISFEDMYTALSLARLPLIGAARPKTAQDYIEVSTAELWLALTAQRFAELQKGLEASAERHCDDIVFRWLDPKSEFASGPLVSLHLSSAKDTAAIRRDDKNGKKKVYLFGEEETFTLDGLEKFINDYLNGKLHPFVLGETLTAQEMEYTADKIGKLSAKNIDAVVRNNDLRHIVLFTSITCKRCRVYEQRFADFMKKHYKSLDGYRWYTFDVLKNELPEDLPQETFPVIGRFTGTDEDYYEGKWDEKQMLSFLNEPDDDNQNYMRKEREQEDEALEESEAKKEKEKEEQAKKEKEVKEKEVEEKKEL